MIKQNPPTTDISVVLMCYKEGQPAADFIKVVQQLLSARNLSYELVLVANYFPAEKDSPAVLENARILRKLAEEDPRIVVIEKEKYGGFGWDVRSGIEAATGNSVALIDGDGQMSAEDIVKIYDILSLGGYDFVKTFRARRDDGSWRTMTSLFYNLLIRVLFPLVFSGDVNGKPKIWTRESLKKLKLVSDGWFIDAEMLVQGAYLDLRSVEVSTVFNDLSHRQSYVRPMAILRWIRDALVYRFVEIKTFKKHLHSLK